MGSYRGDVCRAALGTGLSRVLGLVRDVAVAHVFGATAAYDAFWIAFFVPQLLRRLLGEGGLAAAFLPVYIQTEPDSQASLARSAFLALLIFMPPLCLAGSLLAPWYIPILAAGFPPEKLALAVWLGRWLFPFIGFVSLSALAGGILNAHGRFLAPALAPAVLNLGMILGAVGLSRAFDPPIFGLVVGVLVGGAGMLILQAPFLRGHLGGPWGPPHPALSEVGSRLLPILGGLVMAEANALVDNRLASYLADGSIAVLQYAMRLFQLPIGVFAVSVTTVALPRLSRAAQVPGEAFAKELRHGFTLTAALMLPALAGLLALGRPIVALLFEHGAFTATDTSRTYGALLGYLSGLWAYALMYLFSRALYSLGRPGIPVLTGAVAVLVNVGLDLWWVGPWGTFGLALATGVAGWVNALLLGVVVWRLRSGWVSPRPVLSAAIASAVMGVAVAALDRWGGLAGWAEVLLGVALGIGLYAGLGMALGLPRWFKGEG